LSPAAPALSPFTASSCVRIALSTLGLISIALEHQLSDAPNVDVRYHARKVLVGPLLAVTLRPKHVWSIRTKLQIAGRTRDLAMFNLAIDSKLRGCDVVSLRVEDVALHRHTVDRATVRHTTSEGHKN
jgi:hypothetical protein